MRLLVLLVLSLVASAADVHRISGVVADQTGAPVPAASIDVSGGRLNAPLHFETNAAGEFASGELPSGNYTIKVERPGFQTQQLPVALLNDSRMTITLSLARPTYSIEVRDRTSTLDTSSEAHQDSFVLSQKSFSDLPLKDGDVLSALSSFVNPAGGAAATIVVDGMERTDTSLALSSIQQIRINNNAYSAEFPKPGKGRIEIDTRGGDDQIHGGFIFRARNSLFDARNPLAAEKLPFSRDGYEFNLGGPLWRKKLWFFVDANAEGQQQSQSVAAYLPSGFFQTDTLSPVKHDRFLGRLDWRPTDAQTVSVKYELIYDKAANSGIGGFSLPDLATTLYHHDFRIEVADVYALSPKMLNSFRIALGSNYRSTNSVNDEPLVIVPGAFSNGGVQVNEWRREPRVDMLDTLAITRGKAEWKFGVITNIHPFHTFNADNFGGTYTFASLAAFEAGQPQFLSISAGNPLLSFRQIDYGWFAQYERKIGAASLFLGVRHEFQSGVSRYGNLAPRAAIAFAPGKHHRTVIRLGAGVFYDRRPPAVLEQALRYDGVQSQQYLFSMPAFPVVDPIGTGGLVPASVWRIDPSLTFPRIYQTSATFERQLPGGFIFTADDTYQRGSHLLRARDINAPFLSGLRPDPDQGNIDQIESSASSRGNVLSATLKSPPDRKFQFFAQYALSRLYDDTGGAFPPPPGSAASAAGLFAALLPANSYDLRSEWGRANNDARNRFGLSGTVKLPWRFSFGALVAIRSGLPYTITTGLANPEGSASLRPAGIGRNSVEGPGQISVDTHLGRTFSWTIVERKVDADLGIDSFNVLNHTNYAGYIGVLTSPLFGKANAAMDGRQMQFTFQLRF